MKYRYSSLDTAQRCPAKYKLQYIDMVKLTDLGIPESGDMKFGTAMHAAIQALLEGDSAEATFNVYWESIKGENLKWGQWDWQAYSNMSGGFLERFKRLHAKKYAPLAMEQTLQTNLAGVDFEGTPDFVGHVDGVLSLVDFKTSRTAYVSDKLICNPQMYLYAYMAEKKYNIIIDQLVYTVFVKHPGIRIQTIILPLDRVRMQEHLSNLIEQADNLTRTKNYTKNTNSCLMGAYKCEFWQVCWPSSSVSSSVEAPAETSKS